MYPHHRQSIQNVTEYFGRDPQVLALLLGGSIAHGFESRTSDIEILYPCHKWFLKVLEGAKDKPDDLMACLHALHESPTAQSIEPFYEKIKTFQPWSEAPFRWPAQFMLDSELNWMDRRTPVDDL